MHEDESPQSTESVFPIVHVAVQAPVPQTSPCSIPPPKPLSQAWVPLQLTPQVSDPRHSMVALRHDCVPEHCTLSGPLPVMVSPSHDCPPEHSTTHDTADGQTSCCPPCPHGPGPLQSIVQTPPPHVVQGEVHWPGFSRGEQTSHWLLGLLAPGAYVVPAIVQPASQVPSMQYSIPWHEVRFGAFAHAVVLAVGLHTWHAFPGSAVPAAKN